MKKYTATAILFFMINGIYFWSAPGKASFAATNATSTEKIETCYNTESLANSLHLQEFHAKDPFDVSEKPKNELLKSFKVQANQEKHLYFARAKRISGECAIHLDDIRPSLYHFDTGIVLITTKEGLFIPPTKKYYPRPIVGKDDAHPEMTHRQFIEAVEIGRGYFVGVWEQNGKSILTYYKEMPSGEFRIHGDILESETKILIVRRFPHLDTPSCTIQILLQDGNDRVVLDFIWFFPDDMD